MLDEVERYPRIYNDDDQPVASAKSYPGDPEQGLACMGISATGIAPSWPRSGAALAPGSPAASRQQSPVGATAAKASADAASSAAAAAAAAAAATGSTAAASSATATAAAPAFHPTDSQGEPRAWRLLLMTKTARWRLQEQAGGPALEESSHLEAMQLACEAHERAVQSVMRAIGEAAIEVRAHEARAEVPPADLEWADACLALGGDGTMLRASQVAPPGMRVVGVNTDPQRSVGKLCAVAVGPRDPAADAAAFVRALARGELAERAPPRLRVTIYDGPGSGDARVLHAINECFLGEADGARPIDVRLSLDGGPWSAWRSSGIIVASQVGSSAWMRSAVQCSSEHVAAVLDAAARVRSGEVASSPTPSQLSAIAAVANSTLTRHDDPRELQYLVREAMVRSGGGLVQSDGGGPSPEPHGRGGHIQMRPSGWNMVVSLDGLPPEPLSKDCVVDVRVEPEQDLWLRTIDGSFAA